MGAWVVVFVIEDMMWGSWKLRYRGGFVGCWECYFVLLGIESGYVSANQSPSRSKSSICYCRVSRLSMFTVGRGAEME
jgi:hypothetical protein